MSTASPSVFDLLVVGGGAFGLGTAAEAARRGRRVAVVERGPLPNPVAASYGPSRKIRSTYTEPHYAYLAREAMTAWRQTVPLPSRRQTPPSAPMETCGGFQPP